MASIENRGKIFSLFMTAMVAGLIFLPVVSADDEAKTLLGDFLKENNVEVEVSGEVAYYNKYIWRGFLLDNDPVVQPSVTLSAFGFEGGFWGSWDVVQDDARASDEVDGWIGYSFDLGFINENLSVVGISAGNTWYSFPTADGYTKELYVGLSLDVLLSPYFTWYQDYGDEAQGGADGNYYMVGISHSFDLIKEYGITLDLGEEVGFNNEAFIVGDGGYYMTTVGLTVPLTGTLTMAPNVGWTFPFGDLEDAADGAQEQEFFAGVALSAAF